MAERGGYRWPDRVSPGSAGAPCRRLTTNSLCPWTLSPASSTRAKQPPPSRKRRMFMNQYTILARNHWRTQLRHRYLALTDPDAFFTQLGLEAMEEIDNLALALEGPDPAGETFLAKAQRLHAA